MTARRQASPTGVIETLSAGYAAVNRQPWVLVLPVLLNVFLWLGPHVSYSPLLGPVVTDATQWTRQIAIGQRRISASDPSVVSVLNESGQWLIARSDDTNGLNALTWGPIGLPTLDGLPSTSEEVAFVNGWGDGIALLGASIGLSLLLGGWFYGGLAGASSGRGGSPLAVSRRLPRALLDVLGLVGVLLAAALLFAVPILLVIDFSLYVSPPVALMGALLLAAGVIFAGVHLFFSIPAIFVSEAGPMLAIQQSITVVRKHLLPSLALILLTLLILAGMSQVWQLLANQLQTPFGVILGILGNAYIASGLIAAGMVFYAQRIESLPASVGAPGK